MMTTEIKAGDWVREVYYVQKWERDHYGYMQATREIPQYRFAKVPRLRPAQHRAPHRRRLYGQAGQRDAGCMISARAAVKAWAKGFDGD